MKKIFLILDYSNTIEKQLSTLNLIKKIKKEGYDVFISSHVQLPKFITEIVDYYYYDSNNHLIFDFDLIEPVYFYCDNFQIKFKPMFTISTHHFAILRLLLPTLTSIKSLGYRIVHLIEYDNIIKDFNKIKILEKNLDNYDVLGFIERKFNNLKWLHGNYHILNVSKFNYSELEYDFQKCQKIFREEFNRMSEFAGERTTYNLLFRDKNIYSTELNELSEILDYNLYTKNILYGNIGNKVALINENNKILLFVNNLESEKETKIDIIFNGDELKRFTINQYNWFLCDTFKIINEINTIEINIDNKYYRKINLKSESDLKLLSDNTINYNK